MIIVGQGAGGFVADAAVGAGDDGDAAALVGYIIDCPVIVFTHDYSPFIKITLIY
jgi:hypothetical protein